MKISKFKEVNVTYAENQSEYHQIPVFKKEDGEIICCWELSFKERLKVLFGGKIWHRILTFNHKLQPQLLEVDKPEMKDE